MTAAPASETCFGLITAGLVPARIGCVLFERRDLRR